MVDHIVVTRVPFDGVVDALRAVGDLWVWPHDRPIDRTTLIDRVSTADGLYCMLTDAIDADVIESAPNLRVISTMAVGVDNIDLDACRRRGIAVGHTPDVLTESTADIAWALLLAASRRVIEGVDQVRSGQWGLWNPRAGLGRDVSGSRLGIVGMGRIGRAVAARGIGFDVDILYASRRRHPDVEDRYGAIALPLDDLLAEADHVVLCVPLDATTRRLIDSGALSRMKRTATLVNVSRGGVVDTDALVSALERGVIAAAGLDVTDPEPLPADHPLVSLPNCVVVPHIGSATERTRRAMADLAVTNLVTGLGGGPMPARAI
jgi:lactate dehydrogenase-like 2-hydroxyacid dehydrogenase